MIIKPVLSCLHPGIGIEQFVSTRVLRLSKRPGRRILFLATLVSLNSDGSYSAFLPLPIYVQLARRSQNTQLILVSTMWLPMLFGVDTSTIIDCYLMSESRWLSANTSCKPAPRRIKYSSLRFLNKVLRSSIFPAS